MKYRIISALLCLCLTLEALPLDVCALDSSGGDSNSASDNTAITVTDTAAGVYSLSYKTVNDVLAQSKFKARQGHGFAAERGNDLADKIKGKNTAVIGNDNVKNGADRRIIERNGKVVLIQDKYYKTAKEGINACFDDLGKFKYVDGDGNPMQIEVPKEQYDEAIQLMKKKIENGEMKNAGITDPNEAENLIRKGSLSYEQAKNLAKSGTLESLVYDSKNGAVSAMTALGISALITYSLYRLSGEEKAEAVKGAAEEGFKTAGLVFGTSVIAGQLAKTEVVNAFTPSSEAIVKVLGEDVAKALVKSAGKDVLANTEETAAQTLTKQAAKTLRAHAVIAAVTIVVFSIPDAIDLFNGRISKKQFMKDFVVTAVGVVAGTVGFVVGVGGGNLVVPGIGTIPGAVVGTVLGVVTGAAGGFAADKIMDYVTDDDAEEMYEIVQDTFAQKCNDYLVTEAEANNIIDSFNGMLDKDMFKDMYQSKDRKMFIDNKLDPLFVQEIQKREKLEEPTEEEFRAALKEELQGAIFIH